MAVTIFNVQGRSQYRYTDLSDIVWPTGHAVNDLMIVFFSIRGNYDPSNNSFSTFLSNFDSILVDEANGISGGGDVHYGVAYKVATSNTMPDISCYDAGGANTNNIATASFITLRGAGIPTTLAQGSRLNNIRSNPPTGGTVAIDDMVLWGLGFTNDSGTNNLSAYSASGVGTITEEDHQFTTVGGGNQHHLLSAIATSTTVGTLSINQSGNVGTGYSYGVIRVPVASIVNTITSTGDGTTEPQTSDGVGIFLHTGSGSSESISQEGIGEGSVLIVKNGTGSVIVSKQFVTTTVNIIRNAAGFISVKKQTSSGIGKAFSIITSTGSGSVQAQRGTGSGSAISIITGTSDTTSEPQIASGEGIALLYVLGTGNSQSEPQIANGLGINEPLITLIEISGTISVSNQVSFGFISVPLPPSAIEKDTTVFVKLGSDITKFSELGSINTVFPTLGNSDTIFLNSGDGLMTETALKKLDPDDVQPFGLDVSQRLVTGDTIASYIFPKVVNVTINSHQQSNGVITLVLANATKGANMASVTVRVTTTFGYMFDNTLKIMIRDRD